MKPTKDTCRRKRQRSSNTTTPAKQHNNETPMQQQAIEETSVKFNDLLMHSEPSIAIRSAEQSQDRAYQVIHVEANEDLRSVQRLRVRQKKRRQPQPKHKCSWSQNFEETNINIVITYLKERLRQDKAMTCGERVKNKDTWMTYKESLTRNSRSTEQNMVR